MTTKAKELLATLVLLFASNGIFEIRILRTAQGTVSGYFNNPQIAVKEIEKYIGEHDIYVTLNPPNPALLTRSENKLTLNATKTTADSDITALKWLLVDIDPARPSGVSATEEEKSEARRIAAIIRKEVRERFGFPEPIVADSGNGYHLVYQVALENTRENTVLLKTLLRTLDFLYSSDKAHVDLTTYNPSRIVKLWGTTACKGENTKERPHRDSAVIKTPSEIITVPIEAVRRVIDDLPTAGNTPSGAKKQISVKPIDIKKWLEEHGIPVYHVKDDGAGGKIYVLSDCPWRSEHTNRSAYVIQHANGALSAGCHHNSCQNENWHTLRAKYESKSPPPATTAKRNAEGTHFDRIKSLAEKRKVSFFTDQKGDAYAIVPLGKNRDALKVESNAFKSWCSFEYFNETQTMFSDDAWKQAKTYFGGVAQFRSPKKQMYTRCAWVDGALYYDLNNDKKQVVRITAEGWEITTDYDILFYRHKTMSEQVAPVHGNSDLSILDGFYRFTNEDDRILHHISLITKLLPQISHPIDVFHGVKGASKTTTLRKDKSIVDPDRCDIIGLPKTKDDLAIMLDKHYFLCLDNITSISSEISDLLCLACTGGAYSKRKLYSDDKEIILNFKQPVSMNGINVVATKPDLLDRCILFELDSISTTERITESKMWNEFDSAKPIILGMIFTMLSDAIRIVPTVALEEHFRLADFSEWGSAVAEATGIGKGRFLDILLGNSAKANDEAVASHPVAVAVVKLMENRIEWRGNASQLLSELTTVANAEGIDTKSTLWPRIPNGLSRRLKEVKVNLEQIGLKFENQTSGNRLFRIWQSQSALANSADVPEQISIPTYNRPVARTASPPVSGNATMGANEDNSGLTLPNGFVELQSEDELPF